MFGGVFFWHESTMLLWMGVLVGFLVCEVFFGLQRHFHRVYKLVLCLFLKHPACVMFFLYGLCMVFSVQHVWCFFGICLPCAFFFWCGFGAFVGVVLVLRERL